MAALEIVMVGAALLLLVTVFLYVWQQLGWIGPRTHTHDTPPHKHVDVPPHDHGDMRN